MGGTLVVSGKVCVGVDVYVQHLGALNVGRFEVIGRRFHINRARIRSWIGVFTARLSDPARAGPPSETRLMIVKPHQDYNQKMAKKKRI